MLMPSIFGESLLDNLFDVPEFHGVTDHNHAKNNVMRTDVKENDKSFEISMNLPGFRKDDVQAELKDGYLTIKASKNTSNDEKDDNGRYIRRERYTGSCSRSFYVGENMTQEDIKAKFEDGVLKLEIPKKEEKPEVEEKKYITIEG